MIGSKNLKEIEEALLYIDEHLSEKITLQMLAEKLYFSTYYFHRLFKSVIGTSVMAYVRERRIMFARKYLCEGELPIKEIVLMCGFCSSQAFSRAFKKATGLSPSEYRECGEVLPILSATEMIERRNA